MRPGLHGNLLRNRGQRSRRLHNRPHTFSLSRLLMMVFVGAIMFVPGLTLTIIGLQEASLDTLAPGERIMYKALGPALAVLGIGTLFGAAVYYCCFAVGNNNRRPASNQLVSFMALWNKRGLMSKKKKKRKKKSDSNKEENIESSLMSGDSERHKKHPHSHHNHHEENGHNSDTPDMSHRHHHHSYHRHDNDIDGRVPLAYIDDDSIKEPLSPVAIQIDNSAALNIPEVRISPCSSYQGSILNGEVRASSPT